MPAITLTCLAPGLKRIIEHEAVTHIPDLAERQIFLRLVAALADCQGTFMGFEAAPVSEPQPGSTKRAKRAPSAYNLHMKKCASSKAKGGQGKDFKSCAVEWKAARPPKK